MKTHYLIDFENVHEDGIKVLNRACDADTIYLFYTQNAAKIGLDALAVINARICVIKVAAGKQSLDMHLVSYLGYLLWKYGKEDEYIIVSNDTDFDSVLDHWRNEYGYEHLSRLGTGSRTAVQEQDSRYSALNEKLGVLLAKGDAESSAAEGVIAAVVKYYDEQNRKQQIYIELIKRFGQKNGLRYYNLIKKEL